MYLKKKKMFYLQDRLSCRVALVLFWFFFLRFLCVNFFGGFGVILVHMYYKLPSVPLNGRHQSAHGQVPSCLFPPIVGLAALLALSQSHEAVIAVWLHLPMGTNAYRRPRYTREIQNNEALYFFFLYFIYSFCFLFFLTFLPLRIVYS